MTVSLSHLEEEGIDVKEVSLSLKGRRRERKME